MRKKVFTLILFLTFFSSLMVLGYHIFPEFRTGNTEKAHPSLLSNAGNYEKVAEVSLGKVEVRGFQQMDLKPGLLKFSPRQDSVLVGTEDGTVMLLTLQGKRIWSRKAGMGQITALEFSRDGQQIYIGEISQAGALICVDAATGSELWRKSSADELGADLRQKNFPSIRYITTDENGNGYMVAIRSSYVGGQVESVSRIYRFNHQGQVELLPKDHNRDDRIVWVSVDKPGKMLTFGTFNGSPGIWHRYNHVINAIDAKTGAERWSYDIPPVYPYDRTNVRMGPAISDDGNYTAGVSTDGRAFFFDMTGKLMWIRSLSQPQKVQGTFINVGGLEVRHIGQYVAFSVGGTYNKANWQLPTPVEHPQSNSLYVFDRNGTLVAKRKLGGIPSQLEVSSNHLAVAIGRNFHTKDVGVHGIVLFKTPELGLVDRLSTIGPCVALASSADATWIVGIEVPLLLDNGEVVGSYRVHIWKSVGGNS
jgi:outer membrane protein assembly factor BamB